MDSLIVAASRALAVGDALGALKRIGLREDASALALRGIAMAQLGDYPRARELLRRAARGFGAREHVARARCVVAEAEVALALRDFGGSPRALADAAAVLEARADRANALHARLLLVRRLLLLGRLDEAATALLGVDVPSLPPALMAVAELAATELALRALRTGQARVALGRAFRAAQRAGVPALLAEVGEAAAVLNRCAARCIRSGQERSLRLEDVEALLASDVLVVDACRRGLRVGERWQSLARRPLLFALLRTLAEAWPSDVDRNTLIAQLFRTLHPDETHRARLRVEMGRLRALVAAEMEITATARGFVLVPREERPVVVLVPPIDSKQDALLALLADGSAWSTSALALALGDSAVEPRQARPGPMNGATSQRTVQRALAELEDSGQVRSIGRGRAQRWLAAPLLGFTTILLLPAALPLD